MKPSEKLAELYPTIEDIENDRKHYPSWTAMAKAIGVSKQALYDHRIRLGAPMAKRKNNKQPMPEFQKELLASEIDENIKEMMKTESTNIFDRYKIVDPIFYENTHGYDGLEFVSREKGPTWRCIHNPNIRTEGEMV